MAVAVVAGAGAPATERVVAGGSASRRCGCWRQALAWWMSLPMRPRADRRWRPTIAGSCACWRGGRGASSRPSWGPRTTTCRPTTFRRIRRAAPRIGRRRPTSASRWRRTWRPTTSAISSAGEVVERTDAHAGRDGQAAALPRSLLQLVRHANARAAVADLHLDGRQRQPRRPSDRAGSRPVADGRRPDPSTGDLRRHRGHPRSDERAAGVARDAGRGGGRSRRAARSIVDAGADAVRRARPARSPGRRLHAPRRDRPQGRRRGPRARVVVGGAGPTVPERARRPGSDGPVGRAPGRSTRQPRAAGRQARRDSDARRPGPARQDMAIGRRTLAHRRDGPGTRRLRSANGCRE